MLAVVFELSAAIPVLLSVAPQPGDILGHHHIEFVRTRGLCHRLIAWSLRGPARYSSVGESRDYLESCALGNTFALAKLILD